MNKFIFSLIILLISFGSQAQNTIVKLSKTIEASQQKSISKLISEFYANEFLGNNDSLMLINMKKDKHGVYHHFYQQYSSGVKVNDALISFHSVKSVVFGYNGSLVNVNSIIDTINILSPEQAIDIAKENIKAIEYAWENESFDSITVDLGREKGIRPVPELALFLIEDKITLAYKLEIYATNPHGRYAIYLNANSGDLLSKINLIEHINGPCSTFHHGTQNIEFDSPVSGVYKLTDTSRNIETYLLSNGSYSSAQIPTSTSINWSSLVQKNKAALDVHWGTEVVYDFLKANGINSFDNANGLIKNYVNYGRNHSSKNNAFWNGLFFTYGSGGGSVFPDPLTTLDVIVHEFTHGLTQHYGGGLTYFGESGAINESISDMLSSIVENSVNNSALYNGLVLDEHVMSDLNGNGIRDLSNPKSHNQPDTYKGVNWKSTRSGFDNGGVHFNSGVGNYWFYLLTQGGAGVNDFGYNYNVSSLLISEVTSIILSSYDYMNSNATYQDFRIATVWAAHYLYNDCSKTQEVIEAWNAVGVGDTTEGCPNVLFGISHNRTQYCNGVSETFINTYAQSPGHKYKWKLDSVPVVMPLTFIKAGFNKLELVVVDTLTGLESVDEVRIFVTDCQPLKSEKEIWYFGYKRGFDFSTGGAVPISFPNWAFETLTTHSVDGDLSFYLSSSNITGNNYGMKLLDRNHNIIQDLAPIENSSQQLGSVAVNPDVTNGHKYVNLLVNASYDSEPGFHSGFYKIVIDIINPATPIFVSMTPVPAPSGFVKAINGAIDAGESTVVIPGCNPYVFWVLIQSRGPSFGTSVFKLDYSQATGNDQGILTFDHQLSGVGYVGSKSVSPNGNYIVVDDKLYAFDRVNGVLSFLEDFPTGFIASKGSFSPNSQYFYVYDENFIYQFDILSSNFVGSKTVIGSLPKLSVKKLYSHSMAIGPNDKVYFACVGPRIGFAATSAKIAVINNPDVKSGIDDVMYNDEGFYYTYGYSNSYRATFPTFTDAKIAKEEPLSLAVNNEGCFDITAMAPSCKSYYSWDFGDGILLTNSDKNIVNHTYSKAGIYTVKLTSKVNGVDTTLFWDITVGFNDSVNIIATDSVCGDAVTFVDATPGFAFYSWSIISGSGKINIPSSKKSSTSITWGTPGTVVLELLVVDQKGCSKAITKSIFVADSELPPVPVKEVLDTLFSYCIIDTLNYPMAKDKCGGILSGYTTAQLPITNKGVTKVEWTYIDKDGMASVQEQIVKIGKIDSSISRNANVLVANAIGFTYQWIDCVTGLSIPGEKNRSYAPQQTGLYAVIVSDGECEVKSECYSYVGLGIENNLIQDVLIYPNPVGDVLRIDSKLKFQVVIYSVQGDLIMKSIKNEIDFKQFSVGVYYVAVFDDNKELITIKKIVKK